MSEVMAIESIAEEYARSQGYLTETRVPFKLRKGNSDFDVIGHNPKTNKSLVIECKAWGSPNQYSSFDTPKRQKQIVSLFKKTLKHWKFFKNSDTNRWRIKKLNALWLVIPGFCNRSKELVKNLQKTLNNKIEFKIIPIHELIMEILNYVKEDKNIRRKRYSNPALEFCRWLLRSYETGHFNLIDVIGEKQTYKILRRNYFKECVRAIQKNQKEIKTRMNTLKVLVAMKKRVPVREIVNRAKKLGFDLNGSRIRVGLGTWQRLGIISGDGKEGYFIVSSFKDIVEKELK